MPLQSSGAISLSQVQSEFGGSNPISMSEYYRNGSYVPSTVTGAWSAWLYSLYVDPFYFWEVAPGYTQIYWVNTTIGSPGANATSFTAGGYDYERGNLADIISTKSGDVYYYYVRRRTSSETVNSSIPTSGQISMSNFYGGRKT